MPTARSSTSPHGSILVNILVRDGRLEVHADFLRLPEKGRVAMLRQVADLTLNRLLLPRFRKEGDRLRMEYVCPLAQSHPHKIYFVLRNICHVGDRYDDEFCTKFGAERCYEPRVTPYSAEECARIVEAIRATCRETLDAVKEYDAERKYGYSWNVIDTAFYKISYFAQPQGQLSNDLDKAVDDMDRGARGGGSSPKDGPSSRRRSRRPGNSSPPTSTSSIRSSRPSAVRRWPTCRRT